MPKVKFELFDDRVLVKPNAAETKNFPVELLFRILPKKAAKRYGGSSWKRKVCRTNRQPDTCDVKEGDVIMYGKYGGTEITN